MQINKFISILDKTCTALGKYLFSKYIVYINIPFVFLLEKTELITYDVKRVSF